ncbi:hypothetical protein OAS86_06135 [Gammaproteobacteria bacterium]|nr:hypothetical protein [Gammaproteobacteria bacterium]
MNYTTALDDQIIAASEAGDASALACLYADAAESKVDDIDAYCFFYTNSYVFALECGDRLRSQTAHRILVRHGRDE